MPRSPRHTHVPRALDVAAFCREGARLEGHWSLAELPRLAGSVLQAADGAPPAAPAAAPQAAGRAPEAAPDGPAPVPGTGVHWRAAGTTLRLAGTAPQCAVDLDLHATVTLECQRCLQPMAVSLAVQRRIRFVETEDEAARLDEELEDDVLALAPRLDLQTLIEDELLLALPLVPRHAQCPQLPELLQADRVEPAQPAGEPTGGEPAPHPFAALEALRRPKG